MSDELREMREATSIFDDTRHGDDLRRWADRLEHLESIVTDLANTPDPSYDNKRGDIVCRYCHASTTTAGRPPHD